MLASSRCVVSRSWRPQLRVSFQPVKSARECNGNAFQKARRFTTVPPPGSSSSSSSGRSARDTSFNDEPATVVMSNGIRMKNAGMALTLFGFCFGVAFYSMNAVGQAGSGGQDDPLAALKQEAAAAQEKLQRESQQTESTADMLQKFQAGDYDPDVLEQNELEQAQEEAAKKKKAWWKFWARS